MIVLLLLLNLSYSVAAGYGWYTPNLDKLNSWLTLIPKDKIDPNFFLSIDGKINLGSFSLGTEISYSKDKSSDKSQSLQVMPIDITLSYKLRFCPALLSFYTLSGYEWCFVEFDGTSGRATGMGRGIPVEAGVNFVAAPEVSIDFFIGYKFVKAGKLKLKGNGFLSDADESPMPIELSGSIFGFNLRREF